VCDYLQEKRENYVHCLPENSKLRREGNLKKKIVKKNDKIRKLYYKIEFQYKLFHSYTSFRV
jgi:hypothetical protein